MVKNEQGLRVAKLFHVSVENGLTHQSNKFYHLFEQPDGTVRCEWGRVGNPAKITIIQASEFDKVYREKTSSKKGYKDQTELLYETIQDTSINTSITDKGEVVEIACSYVRSLFNDLMAYAKKSVSTNYKAKAADVTEAQVLKAQSIIDNIASNIKIGADIKTLNNQLLDLYSVITREMKDVRNHLFNVIDNQYSLDQALNLIATEQTTLDTMAGQVQYLKQQRETAKLAKPSKKIDLLDQLGLKVAKVVDIKTLNNIKTLMGPNANQLKNVYEVSNIHTQQRFDNHVKCAKDKTTTLLFHGSRNENFFNILQTGLLIRPAGAAYSGSMWDDGIYAASAAQKSIGYTSLRGSYWASGSDSKAFLALFEFHTGRQLHAYKHDSSCYTISKKVKAEGYDSVYAHKGAGIMNEEFIVYNPAQCTIKYLVEIGN